MPPLAAAALALLIAALMLWDQQRVPAPVPASAPAQAFSAQRAMSHVEAIASRTRFLGSPQHDAARRYIVRELRTLGLTPRLQRTAVVNTFSGSDEPEAGTVTNIVARIRGTASTGAVALNAHYDSGPAGPGASDCGSCVAAVLETVRALRAGERPHNDVIVVFSDGEENGDLGAAAFAGQHSLMRRVDAVMNWETAGSHGQSLLMATNSSWLVEQTLDAAPHARTYSVLPSLFRGALKPQQLATDTQEYMDRGAAGVQFAYLRGTRDYHTRLDNSDRLGRGSLQMDGDYGLALTRKLAGQPLRRDTGDRSTYFNVTGGVIVQYGPVVAILLAMAAVGLFFLCLVLGRRRGLLTARGLLLGVATFPLALLVATAVSVVAWLGLKRVVADLDVLTIGTDQNGVLVFGLLALACAVFAALYHPLLRRARPDNLALGALTWWLALTVFFTLTAPSAAYLFALPVLAALGAALWRLGGRSRPEWHTAAGVALPLATLIVVYAPVMLVFTLLALRLDGLGLPAVGAMGLFAALAAGLFVPYLALGDAPERPRRVSWLIPGIAALTATVLLSAGSLRLGFDAANPRPDFVSYVLDADTGDAHWETGDRDSWTAPLLRGAKATDVEPSPFATVSGWRAPARKVHLAAPRVQVVGRKGQTVRLRLSSPRGADAIALDLRVPGAITRARVEGQELPMTASVRRGALQLPYVGLPRRGIDLTVTTRASGMARVTLRDYSQGLPPGAGAPARPRDTMPAAISFRADPTVVSRSARLRF